MRELIVTAFLFILIFCAGLGPAFGQAAQIRFADQLVAFRIADKKEMPPAEAIVFTGSSIIRKWNNLATHMDGMPVINRAFGGSRTAEVLAAADEFVIRYRPSIVVYYCGSNDVNGDILPEMIAANVRAFSERLAGELPLTHMVVLSVIRAPQKANKLDKVDAVNGLLRRHFSSIKGRSFIDINPIFQDASGNARLDLFL